MFRLLYWNLNFIYNKSIWPTYELVRIHCLYKIQKYYISSIRYYGLRCHFPNIPSSPASFSCSMRFPWQIASQSSVRPFISHILHRHAPSVTTSLFFRTNILQRFFSTFFVHSTSTFFNVAILFTRLFYFIVSSLVIGTLIVSVVAALHSLHVPVL